MDFMDIVWLALAAVVGLLVGALVHKSVTTKPVLSKIKHFDFYYFDISPHLPVCTQKNNARGRSHERFGHGFLRKHVASLFGFLAIYCFFCFGNLRLHHYLSRELHGHADSSL